MLFPSIKCHCHVYSLEIALSLELLDTKPWVSLFSSRTETIHHDSSPCFWEPGPAWVALVWSQCDLCFVLVAWSSCLSLFCLHSSGCAHHLPPRVAYGKNTKTNQPTEINDSEEEKSQIRRQSGRGNILEDRLSDATQIIELLYKFHFVSLGSRLPACKNAFGRCFVWFYACM